MSFTVYLCNNKSDRRVLDKDVATILEVNGTLRDDTSIIDPVIVIECDSDVIKSINYIKIPEFKRMYYINNITSLRRNLWELKCHVDVITSFASEIRTNEAIVKRQENNWNLYLNDNSIKCYQNPHVVIKEFPDGFNTLQSSYVLLVAGRPVDGWFNDDNTEV